MRSRSKGRTKRPAVGELLDRPPPACSDAERATLGSVLVDPRCLPDVREIIAPADMRDIRHKVILSTMAAMHDAGELVDAVLLAERLKADGNIELAYLGELVESVPTAAHAAEYARAVRSAADRYNVWSTGADMLARSHDAGDPADIVADARERLDALAPAGRRGGPVVTCMANVEPREIAWLWPGRIPAGRITLLVGRPGEGKSFLTCDAAARVSTGTPWPDGASCPRGSVLFITAEDNPNDVIRPRLDAHFADVGRVHLLSAVRTARRERMVTLTDVPAIEAALAERPDCRLVVVDPIGSFLGGRTDAHRDNEVRGVLAPIAALAEKHGPAVLVVAHRRKGTGNSADDLALGSRAFTGIARAVWHLSREPQNESRRLLLPGKNNLAREGDGLAFTIAGEPARITWEPDPVAMSADEALAAENDGQRGGPDADARDGATIWLRAALADGPRLTKDLLDEWTNGQGGSKRTLERAKQSLGAEAFRPEVPGPWWWRLPHTANNTANAPQGKQPGGLGGVAANTGKTPDSNTAKPNTAKLSLLGGVASDEPPTAARPAPKRQRKRPTAKSHAGNPSTNGTARRRPR